MSIQRTGKRSYQRSEWNEVRNRQGSETYGRNGIGARFRFPWCTSDTAVIAWDNTTSAGLVPGVVCEYRAIALSREGLAGPVPVSLGEGYHPTSPHRPHNETVNNKIK